MLHTIHIKLAIEIQSKWHCGSGEGGLSLNKTVKRDSRNWPHIPGSTLRGVVRESCEKLSRTLAFPSPSDPHQTDLTRSTSWDFQPLGKVCSPVDELFGNRYESGGLFFRDARLSTAPESEPLIQSRICRYRRLGTARQGHLFSTEYMPEMMFKTTIDGYHRDLISSGNEDPPFSYCLLVAGILAVNRLGGDKSTGCGRIRMVIESALFNGTLLEPESIFEYLGLPSIYRLLLEDGGRQCSKRKEIADR